MHSDEKSDNPHATPAENARFAAFAAELAREGLSQSTRACYASDWWTTAEHAFEATRRRFRLDRFRADDFVLLRARLAARGVSPATLNRRLAFLRRYTAFAAEREHALRPIAAEFARLPWQAVARRTTKALTRGQEESLRAAADARGPQDAAILALLLSTGLRASEAADLRREDVLGPAEAPTGVRVRGPRAKTVLVAARTRERLAAHLAARAGRPGEPLFVARAGAALGEAGIGSAVERAARDAGVEATPRTLRHTFGVRYVAEHAGDLDGLAHALGHAGLDAARAYRAEAEAGAPAPALHRWDRLEETEPVPGVRRRAFTGTRLTAARELLAPGASPPPRAFTEERVTFVLSGRVTVRCGTTRIDAGPGEFVTVPGGTAVAVTARGDRPALLLHVRTGTTRETV